MKTQKEKLIDILSIPIHPRIGVAYTEVVADYLLDNDVLPIVRCKDCRFLDNIALNHGICYCEKHHKEIECDGYCSYGERKDDSSVKNKAHERNNIKSVELCERCIYDYENCKLKCVPLKSCEMLDDDGETCKCVKVPLRTPCDYFVERDNY